jgi:hypothetical protein
MAQASDNSWDLLSDQNRISAEEINVSMNNITFDE